MFGRKKESRKAAPPRTTRDPTRPPPKLSAFGLMDVPSIEELENPEEDGADDQVPQRNTKIRGTFTVSVPYYSIVVAITNINTVLFLLFCFRPPWRQNSPS